MRHGLHTTPPNQACVIVPVVSNANANFGYASFWARSPLPSASLEDDATLCGEGSLRQTATPCVPNLSSKYFRVNSTVCTYVWNLSWLRAKAMLWFRPLDAREITSCCVYGIRPGEMRGKIAKQC